MSYIGAPYNFVNISNKVYRTQEMIQPHNVLDPDKISGEIEYEMRAETPIFISRGKSKDHAEEFYKNVYGREAIPGSTVRGMVRSNVQILSCSSYRNDIQNSRLMYRSVADSKSPTAQTYKTILGSRPKIVGTKDGKKVTVTVLKNVTAGYLYHAYGQYYIIPTKQRCVDKSSGKQNYYVASERIMRKKENWDNFSKLPQEKLQYVDGNFKKVIKNGRPHYIGTQNPKYHPYFMDIWYQLKGTDRVAAICPRETGAPEKMQNFQKGTLVSTGEISEKKAVYIVPEMDLEAERIAIPGEDVSSYLRDYRNKENQINKDDREFYMLPENGKIKPVFYIWNEGKLYFGFTPHLRLFYDKDIFAGLSENQKQEGLDYNRLMFGYADTEGAYKSRISFNDAVLAGEAKRLPPAEMILAEPKPTSYADYLKSPDPKKPVVSYNDDFKLRGVKQYWLKHEIDLQEIKSNGNQENKNIKTVIRPLDRGSVFKGKIRFTNLSEQELGMLLWGLILDENCQLNIGKGKPYGYGRIDVKATGLYIMNLKELYGGDSFCLKPYTEETSKINFYINAAKQDIEAFLGKKYSKDPGIRDLMNMKSSDKIPNSENTRYMKIGGKENEYKENEYKQRKNRNQTLGTVSDVLKEKR